MSQIIAAGGGSIVSSIQRGVIDTSGSASATATITSVDTTQSELHYVGEIFSGAGATDAQARIRLTLTNATTITATRNTSNGNINSVTYEIIQYASGIVKTVNTGTIANGGTATVTAVDTTKSLLHWLGFSTSTATSDPANGSRVVLTNSTTITATISTAGITTSYQLMEFN